MLSLLFSDTHWHFPLYSNKELQSVFNNYFCCFHQFHTYNSHSILYRLYWKYFIRKHNQLVEDLQNAAEISANIVLVYKNNVANCKEITNVTKMPLLFMFYVWWVWIEHFHKADRVLRSLCFVCLWSCWGRCHTLCQNLGLCSDMDAGHPSIAPCALQEPEQYEEPHI